MACRCGPTVGDFLAEAGQPPIEELIGDLAWLDQVDYNGRYVNIRGIIKPDLSLKSTPELRAQLMASYNKIIYTLELAGMPFASMPELELTGKARCHSSGGVEFGDIGARIRIELVAIR